MKQGDLSGSRNRKGRLLKTPTSRPNASLVKVESIFINIVAAEQIKPEKCEHFTIRGFVSDSREQNGKLHWPFSIDENGTAPEEISSALYPLHTPQFRSWRCQSCLNEIDSTAAAKKERHSFSVKCRRQLKAKSSRSHRSLENVIAYLSEKLKQPSVRGRTLCKGIKSASKFKQKQKLDTDGHQKESLRLSTPATSTKSVLVDDSQYKGKHVAAAKLVQRQHEDSTGTGRRKSKAKKVRLLNEILGKDGKGVQPVLTERFHIDETAKAGCSGSQTHSLQKFELDNVKFQGSQKINNNSHEQDRKWSQTHFKNSAGENGTNRKAQGSNFAFGNTMHGTSSDGGSDANIEHAETTVFERAKRTDGHKIYLDRGQKTNNDSYERREQLSTCLPLHGRVTDSLHNSNLPHSHLRGKSNDTIQKVHQGAYMMAPSDNSKGLEGNSVTRTLMETIQIGHQSQYLQPMQDGNSIRQHCSFADGCLDPRKATGDLIPATVNRNYRNDTAVYKGESSTERKSLVGKNIFNGTNNVSVLKRPNQGACNSNKKSKHSRRTGGPTALHQTEVLPRNCNKKASGFLENPENLFCEMRRNMMQEAGTSDIITMEIAELMAKNQYERHLHQGLSHENPHLPNERIIPGKNTDISNGNPKGHIVQQRSTGSTYRPSLLSQQDLPKVFQLHAVGSNKTDIFSIQNCKYDMNKLAPEQRVPRPQAQLELWQPTSQQSHKIDRAWPMVSPNHPADMFSVFQCNNLQSFNVGKVPKCSSYVGDGRDYSNLDLAGKKTSNFRPEESHTLHPNRVDGRPQGMGSPDSYANDAIPAMDLLSLREGHLKSSTPTNIDAFATRKTFDRSFTNDHLARELSRNSFSVGKSNDNFKQPSPYNYHKNPQSDASCRCSPSVPTFSSMALHEYMGNKKGVQASIHHQERAILNTNPGGSILPSGVAFQQLLPTGEFANNLCSPSWSVVGSSDVHINGNLYRYRNSVSRESSDTLIKCAEPRVCRLNRNPMDFTTPGPGNEYMIGPEELKLRTIYPTNVTGKMTANSFKQLGFVKYAAPEKRL